VRGREAVPFPAVRMTAEADTLSLEKAGPLLPPRL
jgi:hypothetical protein